MQPNSPVGLDKQSIFDQLRMKLHSPQGAASAILRRQILEAAESFPKAFSEFLSSVPFDDNCGLFEVYEVLVSDPERHAPILLEEFDRLIRCASDTPGNRNIYSQLDAFSLIPIDSPLAKDLVPLLYSSLKSPVVQVRRVAAWLSGDFLLPSTRQLLDELYALQKGDADWRVRYAAYASLRDFCLDFPEGNAVPTRSFLDWFCATFFKDRAYDFGTT